jgi:hypothetical protein
MMHEISAATCWTIPMRLGSVVAVKKLKTESMPNLVADWNDMRLFGLPSALRHRCWHGMAWHGT